MRSTTAEARYCYALYSQEGLLNHTMRTVTRGRKASLLEKAYGMPHWAEAATVKHSIFSSIHGAEKNIWLFEK